MIRFLSILLISIAISAPSAVFAGGRDDQRLITGARGKIMPVVLAALKAGADIEARDEIGRTALIWSAFQDHAPMLAYLIDQGADVNAFDQRGRTALIWAAIAGREAAADTLLENGADPAIADADGNTAAAHAVAEGHTDLARRG
jgi:ankyrin repeat protein